MFKYFRYVVGRGVRETGQALERVGLRERDNRSFMSFCRFMFLFIYFP